MEKKLVLIDGHSILNRAFYGVPELTNAKGLHTNAIYGFLNIMFKILEEEKPDYLTVAFDVSAPTFRHKIFEGYKGTRKPMPEELREQIPVMKDVLRAMNIVIVEKAGLEADDILGTLAKKAEADGNVVSLVSGDRDLLQIATKKIKIRIPKTKMGRTTIEDYYEDDVKNLYQVTPTQFIELKALMGDTSDNIPGVPKIGEKTAIDLMVTYGSIDNIYEHIEEITKKSIKATLMENRELADLSKVLATIKVDCELDYSYEDAKAEGFYTKEAYQLLKQLEFKNMLSKFDAALSSEVSELKLQCQVCENDEEMMKVLEKASKEEKPVGFIIYLENKKPVGISIARENQTGNFLYVTENTQTFGQLSLFDEPVRDEDHSKLWEAVKTFSEKVQICTIHIKPQYDFYDDQCMEVKNGYLQVPFFDAQLAAYLLNPLKSDYDAEAIAAEYLNMSIPGEKEFFGKKSFGEMAADQINALGEYCVKQAYVALKAAPILKSALEAHGMGSLMKDIEMPLSYVLYNMEKEGITLKVKELKEYGERLKNRIDVLETEIYALCGESFNINSPKQLGEILFEKLNLSGGKKTKTGYSTAADVLEKLQGEHPVIEKILEYRTLTKLKSTYADGLENYIAEDGRIHSNFNQTITATGRISSTEPNLQNIPIRMELGREIRRSFVPRDGYVFMDADYSQIELRVLAHMSKDQELINAYSMDEDIHRITASKVFGVPFEEVTPLQRRNAKAVNFGIVYGISSFGLSQDLSISKKEAGEYIKQYFETYPGIKTFLDQLVSDGKEHAYVTTMYGRRRPVPELKSSNFMQRSFGERIAMNSPIQGTAADIIKIAMIKVWATLKEKNLCSKLILQVHDELLLEVKKEEVKEVEKVLADCMQHAAELLVKLEVDLKVGDNWYDAH